MRLFESGIHMLLDYSEVARFVAAHSDLVTAP